jgi:hypothetical protein
MKLCLISCSSKKLPNKSLAKDLYIGQLFKFCREYAEINNLPYKILSAEYGLVDPYAEIEPYNKILNSLPNPAIIRWSEMVFEKLCEIEQREITIFAGNCYRQFLIPMLGGYGFQVEVPLRGLSIGKQLRVMKNELLLCRRGNTASN